MQTAFMTVLDAATGAGAGPTRGPNSRAGVQTFQAVHTASASLSSTIKVEGSNVANSSLLGTAGYWVNLGTITLVGSSVVSDALVTEAPYMWYRGNVVSASGVSTAISIFMSQTL
jgi:hypothetical protein